MPRSILLALLLCLGLWLGPARGLAQTSGEERVHVVAAGETLSLLSQEYGVSVAQIMAANDLTDPDRIIVGQRLRIPAAAPAAVRVSVPTGLGPREAARLAPFEFVEEPAPRLPAPFAQIELSPAIIQGQTGIVRVTLTQRLTPAGRFGQIDLHFSLQGWDWRGYRYWAFLPTTPFTPPGVQPLTVTAAATTLERTATIVAGSYGLQDIVLPPGKNDLLAPELVNSEFARVNAFWQQASAGQQWYKRFRFPIAEGFVQSSPYGTLRGYNGGPASGFHAGTDWSAPAGVPIVAPAAGTVVLAENLQVRGGAVIIDHGLGVYSNFWHLSQIDVQPGQTLVAGDAIGLVGTTGLSTGAHLHWEMRINGIAVDPLQWTTELFPLVAVVGVE